MNRLEIPDGGMPLHGDDFRFIDEAMREALKGLIHLYTDTEGNCILSGLEYSVINGQFSCTEGFVCLNNEICYVPSTSFAVGTTVGNIANVNIVADNYYDENGNDVFEDGVSRNTYAIRRAKIINGLSGFGDFVFTSATRMSEVIKEIARPSSKATVTDFLGLWQKVPNTNVIVNLIDELVVLSGKLTKGSTNNNVLSLPIDYAPPKNIYLPVSLIVSGAPVAGIFKIETSGICSVFTSSEVTLSSYDELCLSLTWTKY